MSHWILLAVAVLTAVATTFLTAVETALVGMTPTKAERLAEEGRPGAARAVAITNDPAPATTTTLLLRVACEICCIVTVVWLLRDIVGGSVLWSIVTVVGIVIVAFLAWNIAPKSAGRQYSERIVLAAGRPIGVISTLLWPLSQLLVWIGNIVTPGHGYMDGPYSLEAEKMAEASEGEREMINSVFELGDTLVREVMVPRTDVVYIESYKTLRQGLSLGLRSGFSRIPVVDKGLDDVVGLVYIKDIMRRIYDNPDAEKVETIAKVMRPASFTPDSKPVDELMREMQVSRHHMVVVVDEFGGTSGIATIEDVVEEIVGEITDEYDSDPDLAENLGEDTWRVSARMPVDDMGDLFDLELDDEDVETVGGVLAKELNMVPIQGSQVCWQGLEITADTATARRHQIDTVIVRRLRSDELDDGEDHDE